MKKPIQMAERISRVFRMLFPTRDCFIIQNKEKFNNQGTFDRRKGIYRRRRSGKDPDHVQHDRADGLIVFAGFFKRSVFNPVVDLAYHDVFFPFP